MINKILRHTITIVIVFLVAALCFCGKSGKLRISTATKSEFPIINITNLAGKSIVIQPVSTAVGSIGYEQNGKITWVTGEPVQTKSDSETRYTWKIDAVSQVELLITGQNTDMDFQLSLRTADEKAPAKWYLNISAEKAEYFTGLLERVVDGSQSRSWETGIKTALNLRGEKVEVKLKPTVSAYAPFYISSNNYGFFVKGTWPGVIDFGKEHENIVQIAFEGPTLDFKLYLGSSPREIVQRHALETGPSFVPPTWAFGPWRWRDEHLNHKKYFDSTEVRAPFNSDLIEDVLMMKAYDIPCTAYWVDRPWAPGTRGFDDYEFDNARFPQPQKMIQWLNTKGIEFLIWIAPFVMGKMADYVEENGYDLKSKPRENARQILMDFTNPDACNWWGENGPGKLARMGVRGFKLDRADGEKEMDSLNLKNYIGKTYRENYNDYPRQYVKAAYDAVKPVLGDNFILFPRAQYTGSARYGGLWAGDTNGRPEGLRSAIIALQRCAIMGYPIWGSDTGGYWGDFSHETCKRWLGFSCFSPLMEVGPTNNRGFWDNPDEPHYDAELIATYRLYAKTRIKLIPYLHSLAKEARTTGMPIARPLFLVYPDQPEAWNDWQTYLLGPNILVSAIWESGIETHRLYLPADENWIDAWNTDQIYSSGNYLEVEAPQYKIPIFIRQGSAVQLGDLEALYQESLKIASKKPSLAELEQAEGWR